ncbi:MULTISPECIES: hypothetical protein [Tritonibacter]|uniref:Uncharacterized protein n=1 Tax=Tritonibacter scottomollicae TaxID=483013 RepID=A0A2T1AG59_TRISK|nr:hypothetical protein [Tritonibacter scottomollicae]PRZ47583.1 hypothetical protein CLV89_106116 [Tritonibacter scottomollicae]WOI33192.1 hypothetical protein R1T40_20090 [Tritonibacter scottomollicae]
MKAMLAGFALIAVIAVGADFALERAGFSAQDQNSGAAVRLN